LVGHSGSEVTSSKNANPVKKCKILTLNANPAKKCRICQRKHTSKKMKLYESTPVLFIYSLEVSK